MKIQKNLRSLWYYHIQYIIYQHTYMQKTAEATKEKLLSSLKTSLMMESLEYRKAFKDEQSFWDVM